MPTSLLYHGFRIQGYRVERTDYSGGQITFVISQARCDLRCPRCGTAKVERRGEVVRTFQLLPVGRKSVFAVLGIARVRCEKCAVTRQVKVKFADEGRRRARSFERYVLELLNYMTMQAVARHLQIGWDTVKEIQKRYLQKHFHRPRLSQLRKIAIDEICVGKGRFLTTVLDLERGAVVFVGEGRKAATLKPFWKRLKASHAHVEAVAIDMSRAYTMAVRENLPAAVLVYDHFHIIKLYNQKLSDLRRELHREATTKLAKNVLKGTRWLLLKNPENLKAEKSEPLKLNEALALNESLFIAYYMKEHLRQVWQQPNKTAARQLLQEWLRVAHNSGIGMLQQISKTFAAFREGILAWYDHRISTGPLEGTNNKIKTLQRQAYGFRDMQFFILKIKAIHLATYELVG
ncbi:MAG: ISL3 family transposase [Planctomycetes bacterium]|nr:ISL3 family transposase [Planctomycetota bacterium]